jgi:exodeoxyribonuclease VII small subunit
MSTSTSNNAGKPPLAGSESGVDTFESCLTELESLIGKMEHGGLSLDESVHSFERGMALYETCKTSLEQAQLKVELLLKGASEIGARVPFELGNAQTP